MINKTQITDFLKKITHKESAVTERAAAYPTREWVIGLGVVSVLVVVAGIIAGMWYQLAATSNQDTMVVDSVPVPYVAATVDQALLLWQEKRQRYTGQGGTVAETPVVPELPPADDVATSSPATSTSEQTPAAEEPVVETETGESSVETEGVELSI